MPISEQSLRITDAYRNHVQALVENVQHYSDATWSGDRWLAATAAAVAGAQREAVRATGGYLAAYLSSELGHQVRVPLLNSLSYIGKSRDGQPLNDALLSPLIGLASELKDGLAEPVARANAVKRAKDLIDLAVKEAARRSLQDTMKNEPLIVGWRRAVSGTCDACLGAAEETTAPPGTPLEIHPNCQCVAEPVVQMPRRDVLEDPARVGEAVGSVNRDLGELSEGERGAVAAYKGPNYRAIQKFLREGAPSGYDPELRQEFGWIRGLDSVFARTHRIEQDIRLWRGAGTQGSFERRYGITPDIGTVVEDPGFVSTSMRESVATVWGDPGNIDVWKINVSKGAKAVNVEQVLYGRSVSAFGEAEVLLGRGSRFRVVGVTKEHGNRVIEMELVV